MERLLVFLILSTFQAAVFGGEYIVAYSPQFVHFRQTSSAVNTNEIDSLVTAQFGLASTTPLQWDGLLSGSTFHRPKAAVLVTVYGATNVPLPSDFQRYATTNDEYVNTESVVEKIESVFPTGKSLLVDFSTDDTVFDVEARNPGVFTSLPGVLSDVTTKLSSDLSVLGSVSTLVKSLAVSKEPDVLFLGEILVVREILNQIKLHRHLAIDRYPDFFHFRFQSLSRVSERYGAGSEQVAEANTILGAFVKEITSELRQLYSDNVVVEVVTVTGAPQRATRRGRSLQQSAATDGSSMDNIGLTGTVDEQYSVIFNIILWGMIGLAVALYFISYGIWNMDPGRDSIIYRMTSQRMKRD